MIIGIPIYQQVDLLDVAAPAEIFARTGAIEDAARFCQRHACGIRLIDRIRSVSVVEPRPSADIEVTQ